MNFGAPKETTQTTRVELSPEQKQLLSLAMPGVKQYAATVPQRYQGNTVAGFDPAQMAGQERALAGSQAQDTLAGNAAGTSNFYLGGDIWNPGSNQNLQGAINAATRPLTEAYTENVLPGIGLDAESTGNFGGSRHGVAEGIASRGYLNAVGDTSSKIAQNEYETNLNAQLKALGLLPQTQAAQTAGAITESGVGDVRQGLSQAQLDAAIGGFNYDQLAPFLQSKDIIGLLGALPGGSTTATASGPTTGPLQALGGAAAGASLGSAILPGVGTGVGAGLGALLSLFS